MEIFLLNKLRYRNNQVAATKRRSASLVWLVSVSLSLLLSIAGGPLSYATNTDKHPTATPLSLNPFSLVLEHNPSDDLFGTVAKHISCYPNPAVSYINFKLDKNVPRDAKLFIFSFTGKQMDELALTGDILKVSLDKYYRGLYVYQLRSAKGAILESGKFQVKN